MHSGFDGCCSSVLVLHGEDEEYLRKHDIAAPTPVHLQLEPVGALVLAVNAHGMKG